MIVAVFDVETDRLLEKSKDGKTGHEDLRITVACGVDLNFDCPNTTDEIQTFYGRKDDAVALGGYTLEDLADRLDIADVIVAYNGRWFDLRVMRNHIDSARVDRWEAKLIDPFEAMRDHTGSWVKLDELLEANGLPRKSADGVSAVEWWAAGRKRDVAEYCKDDVSGLVSLLKMGKFAFPVKKWKTTQKKMKQEIASWSELNWTAYLSTQYAKRMPIQVSASCVVSV